jgi:putative transposase
LSTNEKGHITRLVLTGGQTADVKVALNLMPAGRPDKVIADKAYDADWLLHYLDSEAIEAVIPPRKNRLQKRAIDYSTYKQRNVVERTINKLKQYRKIATRYEKTAASFISICCIVATFINLKT